MFRTLSAKKKNMHNFVSFVSVKIYKAQLTQTKQLSIGQFSESARQTLPIGKICIRKYFTIIWIPIKITLFKIGRKVVNVTAPFNSYA